MVYNGNVCFAEFLNKTTVYNRETLAAAVRRPRGQPLLTVSNHHSCFDDPGIWGTHTPLSVQSIPMFINLITHSYV